MNVEYNPQIPARNVPLEDQICTESLNRCRHEAGIKSHGFSRTWVCTKAKGHDGDHVAHWTTILHGKGDAIARWDNPNAKPKTPPTPWDSDYGTVT